MKTHIRARSVQPDGRPLEANAPAAQRMRRFRWRDLRLWLGLAFMLVAMVFGASLMSGSQDTTMVWRASRDLAPGALPAVEPVAVSLGSAAASYASAQQPLEGRMILPVSAGSLVPMSAVSSQSAGAFRRMTVPVDPLHAPVDLSAGDRVDVWATESDGGQTSSAPPVLVLPKVLVVSADRESVGVGGEIAVVIEVPLADVTAVVAAIRSGVVDLASVPLTDLADGGSE